MFELEKAIINWRKRMAAEPSLEPGQIAELESHLRDKTDDLMARGRAPEQAFNEAVRALGETGVIGSQFFKVYTPRASGRPSWQAPRFVPALAWNYIRTALRIFRRNRSFTAINVLGLAVGMAVFILIMLFVRYELSYDRYHANARNIYRVIYKGAHYLGSDVWAMSPAPLAPVLARDIPEVIGATRVKVSEDVLISIGDKHSLEKQIFWTEPQTFKMFSFPFVRGDQAAALKDPFSVLVSERAARRLFGDSDPVGRTITLALAGSPALDFKVGGIFRDIPANSHFVMDIVAPFETEARLQKRDLTLWDNSYLYTYVLLRDGEEARVVDRKFPALITKHVAETHRNLYSLQALSRIHLNSRVNAEISPTGDARFVFLFASIAVLVLVIACVNTMNLATARSLKRGKEVGLRKVVGAGRGQIVRQFLGDSIVLTFIALLLAVGIVLVVLPTFRAFVERDIAFNPFHDMALMPGLILLVLAVGAVAGSYPAFFVSTFRPVSALKGTGASRPKGRGLRNALIIFQFAASIALIVCTTGVRRQLNFIRNLDMGYQRERIMVLPMRRGLRMDVETFKTEIMRNPSVLNVSASSCLPNHVDTTTVANWPGRPDSVKIRIYVLEADYDFVGLYGLKIAQGRDFSRDHPADAAGAFLINESARKALGWDDPVGREFRWGRTGKIVGVLEDYHLHSLHLPIMPLLVSLNPSLNPRAQRFVSAKISGENIPSTVALLRETWQRFAPEYPFEYSFFDDIFDRAYRTEQRLGEIFSAFAGLAVLIACLGLVGLASFTAEQRTKEIGIRRVLGASSSGVIAMLSREFMKWVVLANVIAWPIGYLAMRSWLQNFAYRTSLTVPMFLGAGLAAFLIAAAVISLQTYRAASANPVESIRYE
jgi:putative ABC transport system permease protein